MLKTYSELLLMLGMALLTACEKDGEQYMVSPVTDEQPGDSVNLSLRLMVSTRANSADEYYFHNE